MGADSTETTDHFKHLRDELPWLDDILESELDVAYLTELSLLQVELLELQRYVQAESMRLAILFEGRDAAGKGGAILRFTQHLMPRQYRVVALPKPTAVEQGQWYFQRYVRQLPAPGEVVFFDRSWYNRAVVEPVMGFCTESQYSTFMQQVVEFERMLIDDGLLLVKLWFSVDQPEQKQRLEGRQRNPLKRWKLSTVDMQAQQKWERFTHYKERMFSQTNTDRAPWIVVDGNDKKRARLESMRHVLGLVGYPRVGGIELRITPDPTIVARPALRPSR